MAKSCIPVEKDRVFNVQASAGSGKTHTLALLYLRYLALGGAGNPHRHLLAVTFTNKATGEMKERVLGMLDECARGDYGGKDCLKGKLTGKDAERYLAAILHDYSRFMVSTIDSFFQQVVRGFIRELDINASYDILLDEDALLDDTVSDLLHGLDQPAHKDLRDWLRDYALERVRDGENWNFRDVLARKAKLALTDDYRAHSARGSLWSKENVDRVRLDLRKRVESYEEESKRLAGAVLEAVRLAEVEDALNSNAIGPVKKYDKGEVFPVYGEFGKTAVAAYENPECLAKKGKSGRVQATDVPEKFVAFVEYVRRNGSEYLALKALFKALPELPLLAEVGRAVEQVQKDRGEYLLSSTTQLLRDLIDGCDTPFIYEKWGTMIEHFLLDEFQDTSRTQWDNFRPLLAESVSTRHSDLIVGDVKQSIYRWRDADSSIMIRLPGIDSSLVDGSFSLSENYRSLPVVVAFNNSLFTAMADRWSGVPEIKDLYSSGRCRQHMPEGSRKEGGLVSVTRGAKDDRLAWTARSVRELHDSDAGWKYSHFAVLTRTQKDGVEVAEYLRGQGIPVVSSEAVYLSSVPVVRLLLSALRYLYCDTPSGGKVSLEEFKLTLLLDEDSRRALDGARDRFARLPLYEALELIIETLGLGQRAEHVVYLQGFMDTVSGYMRRSGHDARQFLRWWSENGYKKTLSVSREQDAVTVMTLHKSKGLAFEVVLMPYLEEIFMGMNMKKSPTLWCDTSGLSPDMPLCPVKAFKSWQYSALKDAFAEEEKDCALDAFNMLYVGCTRAKRALMLYCQTPPEKSDSVPPVSRSVLEVVPDLTAHVDDRAYPCVHSGLDGGEEEWRWGGPPAAPEAAKAVAKRERLADPAPYSLDYYAVNTKRRGLRFHTDPDQLSRRERGTLLHNVMAQVYTASDLDAALDRFERAGALRRADRAEVENELRRLMELPAAATWFDGGWQVMPERSIFTRGGVYRPDRVMLRDGEALVIDYKFAARGAKHAAYTRQVSGYMDLLRRMGYASVRGALYYHLPGEVVDVD